jgi:hypothetical protein
VKASGRFFAEVARSNGANILTSGAPALAGTPDSG